MKKFLTLALGVVAMMFASCSNDEPEVPVNGGADSDVYATLTLRLPSASTGRA